MLKINFDRIRNLIKKIADGSDDENASKEVKEESKTLLGTFVDLDKEIDLLIKTYNARKRFDRICCSIIIIFIGVVVYGSVYHTDALINYLRSLLEKVKRNAIEKKSGL